MRISCLHSPLRTLFFAAALYLFAPESAHAQSPGTPPTPTYLFASIPNGTTASQVAAFSVDPSGVLTPVTGSPFLESREGGLVTVDQLNQFVFVLNAGSNDISVLSIDSTGALAELTGAGSPFAAPMPSSGGNAPTGPTSMAVFKSPTANYLYVAYRNGPFPSTGAIVQFQIGTATQPLVPISTTSFEATPLAIVISSQGYLYAALQSTPNGNQPSGVGVFSIDPVSGALNPESDAAAIHFNEQSLAINPNGSFLFDGWGATTGGIEGSPILADGSAVPNPASVPIPLRSPNSPPSAVLVDGTGQLLYVEEHGQAAVYLIDPATGALSTPASNTQLPLTLTLGNTVADPIEPYLYTLTSGQVHVLRTDFTSGALSELPGSPYIVGNGSNGLALTNSAPPSSSGTAAGLTPTVLNFPDTPVSQPSPVELVHLTNTGTQALDVAASKIAITAGDLSDFSLTQNCPPQLQPRDSCIISITFQPAMSGAHQATLTVPDAAGSQSAQLLGTGLAAQSGVTLAPSTLTFGATQTGTTSAPQSVILTNSGAATLHISSILPGGQNPGDFAIASGSAQSGAPPPCALTSYAPNASCSITIAFSPLGAGARSASINIADDAPGTTQTVLLSGTGTGAPVPPPSPTATAAATLSPGALTFTSPFVGTQTPQQSVSVTSSGVSSLHISSVRLDGPNAPDFTLTNDCSLTVAYVPPVQACSISVSFTPSSLGTRIASILITDDATHSPQSIALVGSTQSETLTIVPSPTALGVGLNQSISAGETANFPLQLVSSFNGTVTFSSCSGAPASATCTVPASITVIAHQPANFAITVATVAGSSSTNFLGGLDRRQPPPLSLAGQICLFLLCAALFRRNASRHARRCDAIHQPSPVTLSLSASATIAAILAATLFSASGCGGASTVATATAVTPTAQSQSYTITISPTATTSDNLPVPNVQKIQLTLVVN